MCTVKNTVGKAREILKILMLQIFRKYKFAIFKNSIDQKNIKSLFYKID